MRHSDRMPAEYDEVAITTRAQLRDWLTHNHDTSPGAWLVSWRDDRPKVTYDELVEELLCFGWIDSTARTLDQERSAIRVTPRRAGSAWSRPNKERLERLTRAGLMTEAGRAVVERAQADGSWSFLDDVEALVVPPDLERTLSEYEATDGFAALTPGRRKQLLYWVKSAKRPTTRADRINRTAAAAQQGRSALD